MKDFSRVLHEAHAQSSAAAKQVEERAQEIQTRKERQDRLQGKLMAAEQNVKRANETLAGFRSPRQNLSHEDRQRIAAALEKFQGVIDTFVGEIQTIKSEASENKFRRLEHDAASLLEVLKTSRRKIQKVLG
jgi:hypothetical protein